jgi:hypothetical protein
MVPAARVPSGSPGLSGESQVDLLKGGIDAFIPDQFGHENAEAIVCPVRDGDLGDCVAIEDDIPGLDQRETGAVTFRRSLPAKLKPVDQLAHVLDARG